MALTISGAKSPKIKTIPIRNIKALEIFYFESSKKTENTGLYLRTSSKEAKAVNLSSGKSMKFTDTEVGVVKTASLSIAD